MPKMAIWRF